MTDPGQNRRFRVFVCIVALCYLFGMSRDIGEPWVGRHDWNGAFFSQLGRNLLRYPFAFHHGIPVVAMGANTPAEGEYSFYPRHPPGLVWLVGGFFKIGGESEWVARCVPIGFSFAALLLLIHIVSRAYGERVGLLSGLLYSLMPMTVYFGRMVNHEPVCLCLMLAAAACWIELVEKEMTSSAAWRACIGWSLAVAATVWVDWPGLLFGVVFFPLILHSWKRQRIRGLHAVTMCLSVSVAGFSVSTYLAEYGFNGQWSAFTDMIKGRTKILRGKPWWETLEWIPGNLTWPVVALFGVGFLMLAYRITRSSKLVHPSDADNSACSDSIGQFAAKSAIWICGICGVLWVLIFWRQFQIHEYWMFYCGPAIACCAAVAIVGISDLAARANEKRTHVMTALLIAGVGFGCFKGQLSKFAAIDFHEQAVNSFKQMAAATKPDQRVVFTWNPVTPDGFGSFVLQNIVPPQLAYYIDRAFDVETDRNRIRQRIADGAFVIDNGQ